MEHAQIRIIYAKTNIKVLYLPPRCLANIIYLSCCIPYHAEGEGARSPARRPRGACAYSAQRHRGIGIGHGRAEQREPRGPQTVCNVFNTIKNVIFILGLTLMLLGAAIYSGANLMPSQSRGPFQGYGMSMIVGGVVGTAIAVASPVHTQHRCASERRQRGGIQRQHAPA